MARQAAVAVTAHPRLITAAGTAISILLAVAIAVMDFSLLPTFRGVGLATPVDGAWSNRR